MQQCSGYGASTASYLKTAILSYPWGDLLFTSLAWSILSKLLLPKLSCFPHEVLFAAGFGNGSLLFPPSPPLISPLILFDFNKWREQTFLIR